MTTLGKGTPKMYHQVLRWALVLKTGHIVCIATHDQNVLPLITDPFLYGVWSLLPRSLTSCGTM